MLLTQSSITKKIEAKFNTLYPQKWIPLYSQVTFSTIRYSEALKKGKQQDKIMKEIMKTPNIENIWDDQSIMDKILSKI